MNDALLNIENELMQLVKEKVVVKINQNKRVMLRVHSKKKNILYLSMHHIFLEAPKEITQAVAQFLLGKKDPLSDLRIKEYITLHLPEKVIPKKLITIGDCYDLKYFFDEINQEYFENKLDLRISWFSTPIKKRRKSRILGRFCSVEKIIWINRFLDQPKIPKYFLSFVIFHEIAHHFVKTTVNKNGRYQLHGKDFKAFEQKFAHYLDAVTWQKKNQKFLLKG